MHDGNNTLILFTLIYIGGTWKRATIQILQVPKLCEYTFQQGNQGLGNISNPLINQVKRTALHIDINSMAVLKLINLQPNVTKLSLTSLQYKVSFYSKSKVP